MNHIGPEADNTVVGLANPGKQKECQKVAEELISSSIMVRTVVKDMKFILSFKGVDVGIDASCPLVVPDK